MDDPPYTSPDEDPFHVLPPPTFYHLHRRPSSLLDKWIQQQRAELPDIASLHIPGPSSPSPESPRAGTPTHAYLAYPDLSTLSVNQRDEVSSLHSYDLVDDQDIPDDTLVAPVPEGSSLAQRGPAGTGRPAASPRSNKQSTKGLLSASPFRNLNLSFRPTSHPIGLTSASDDNTTTPSPRTSSRMSLFARSSRQSSTNLAPLNTTPSYHARSTSLSTLDMTPTSPTIKSPSSKWRPSVLGHFSQPSTSSVVPADSPADTVYTPPRPSLSSGDTYISGNSASQTTTTIDSEPPSTPSKPSFLESIRSKNRSSLSIFKPTHGFASSSSLWSPSRPHFEDLHEEGTPDDHLSTGGPSSPCRPSVVPKPEGQYDNLLDDDDDLENYVPPPTKRESALSSISFSSNNTFSRVSFSSLASKHHRKKKRLVISGVGVHETRKFEGVKRWCETFGEIRQITRVANGDLHIDFRLAEVADTVCRVRAKVFISGVGSVYLSWTTSDKR
ncbi:hypothetical protein MD484_g6125, partial [Candolleomyces efflorescens]